MEGGGEGRFDVTVAVTTPDESRGRWAGERGMDEDQRRAIEARQLTGEEKARRADVVVENDEDLDKLRERARTLVEWLLGQRGFGGEEGAREQ